MPTDDLQANKMDPALTLVGTVLDGKYRLDSLIGTGAMGGVYAGMHIDLNKKVAVKVLHPWLAQEMRARQRFLQEARAVCSLCHPNVVAVDRCGQDNNHIYIAMEYLDGESLADRIKRQGHLPVDEAVHITSNAAAGLAHAHAQGILHRDVKPSNIMLTSTADGIGVHLVDFGIAKFNQLDAEQQQSLTSTNGMVGTPYYMSPEQCSRQELDARSDVYSLGCVLYEALTGKVPFEGDTPLSVMLAHSQADVPPLPARVPVWLQAVVAKAMARDVDERYQDMSEFRQALLDKKQAPKLARRKTAVRPSYIIFALSFVVCVVGFVYWSLHSPKPQTEAGLRRLTPAEALDSKRALESEVGALRRTNNGDGMVALFDSYLAHVPDDVSQDEMRVAAIDNVGAVADVLRTGGQLQKAETLYAALRRYRDAGSESHIVNQAMWNQMPQMIANDLRLEHLQEAAKDSDYWLASTKKYEGANSLQHALALVTAGDVDVIGQSISSAKLKYAEAARIANATYARTAEDKVRKERVYEGCALYYAALDPEAALRVATSCLDFLHITQPVPMQLAGAYFTLAEIQGRLGRWDEAGRSWDTAVEVMQNVTENRDLMIVAHAAALAEVARDSKGDDRALKLMERGMVLAAELKDPNAAGLLCRIQCAKIFELQHLKRFKERDELATALLKQWPSDFQHGALLDAYSTALTEGPDLKLAEQYLQKDLQWDINNNHPQSDVFNDLCRVVAVRDLLRDVAGRDAAMRMLSQYATTETLKRRFEVVKHLVH